MDDQKEEKRQLTNELAELHQRTSELEMRENVGWQAGKSGRDGEAHYRDLFDHIPVGLYRTTPTGQVLDANAALVQILGYPDRESLLAINAVDVYLDPKSRTQWQTLMERDGVVWNFETQLRRADGSIVWVEQNSRVLRDVDGQVLCYEGSFEDITERKQMEEALKENEGRFKTILESVQTGIVIIDPETHRIVDANLVAVKLIGEPKEKIVGSVCHKYICSAEEGHCPITDLAQTVDSSERVLLTAKGEKLPIIKTVVSVVLGGREHLLESFIDITLRKRAEEALKESEKKYKKIFENVQDVFYQANNRGEIIEISPSIERYSGYAREELLGKPIEEVYFNPEDRVGFLKAIGEKGEVADYEVRLKSKDNRLIYTSVNAHFLYDSAGKPIGVEGTLRDVTEQKKAKEELRKSEERFKDLYDNAPVGYHEYDKEGRITRVNQTDLEMLGYTQDEMIGRPIWEFNVEREVAREQILEKLAGSRSPGRGLERTYRRKDGTTFPVLIEDRLILDENRRIIGIRCTIQDITECKQTEEKLARQNRELEILNQTKDRFLGMAAHDLRNPLTVVKVSTKLLQGRTTKPIRQTILNNIAKATEKMLALIDSLLDVSKIRSGRLEMRLEDVDVREFLNKCYEANEMIGRQKGIALIMSAAEDIGHARFDNERMQQAVDNLLSNAFKYSNPNTTVTLGARRSGKGLEIWVEDQGVGIKDEDLPLLFAEFSKASAQPTAGEPSHGLGLAIVKRVVELQGGSIEAKSSPSGGAIFTITLP